MARKQHVPFFPFSFRKLLRKSSLSGLILLFVWIIFQFAENAPISRPIKIPASDAPVELYSNQTRDDLTRLYLEAIKNAKKSIILIIYSLTDENIIDALKQKCEEGTSVHIVCHAKASPSIFSSRIPRATIVRRCSRGLMHQKILIIDSRQIWLGSANLTSSSLNMHGNLVMGIDHPALAEGLTARAKSMDAEGGVEPLLHCLTKAGPQHLEQWVLPDDSAASKRLIELIRSAKKSIKVAMFTWTRVDFTKELIAAAKRGVHVEAVIDGKSGKRTSAKIVSLLERGGIPVRLSNSQGLLHHKFAYIDEKTLVNGSANWTKQAFESNDDYFLVVYPLTPEQQNKMNQLWSVIQKQSERGV
jgi:cardiolipin synthase A/B